jgi:hypothetical protein
LVNHPVPKNTFLKLFFRLSGTQSFAVTYLPSFFGSGLTLLVPILGISISA